MSLQEGACLKSCSTAQQLVGLNRIPAFQECLGSVLSLTSDVLPYECPYCKAASSCSQLSASLHWCCKLFLACLFSLPMLEEALLSGDAQRFQKSVDRLLPEVRVCLLVGRTQYSARHLFGSQTYCSKSQQIESSKRSYKAEN